MSGPATATSTPISSPTRARSVRCWRRVTPPPTTRRIRFFADQKIWADFADWLGVVPEVNFGVFTFEAEAAFLAYVPDVIRGDAALDDALETYERRLTQAIR